MYTLQELLTLFEDIIEEQNKLFKRLNALKEEGDEFTKSWQIAMHVMYFDDPPLNELLFYHTTMREILSRQRCVLTDIHNCNNQLESINKLLDIT
jgi:hypothetical protein